jgi:hypothetical protein
VSAEEVPQQVDPPKEAKPRRLTTYVVLEQNGDGTYKVVKEGVEAQSSDGAIRAVVSRDDELDVGMVAVPTSSFQLKRVRTEAVRTIKLV